MNYTALTFIDFGLKKREEILDRVEYAEYQLPLMDKLLDFHDKMVTGKVVQLTDSDFLKYLKNLKIIERAEKRIGSDKRLELLGEIEKYFRLQKVKPETAELRGVSDGG